MTSGDKAKTANSQREKEVNRLWTRLGDASEYEEWGSDLAAVAGILAEARIDPHEMRQIRGGLVCPGFEQANNVSLYWGDEGANMLADLSRDEFQELKREMTRETQTGSLSP